MRLKQKQSLFNINNWLAANLMQASIIYELLFLLLLIQFWFAYLPKSKLSDLLLSVHNVWPPDGAINLAMPSVWNCLWESFPVCLVAKFGVSATCYSRSTTQSCKHHNTEGQTCFRDGKLVVWKSSAWKLESSTVYSVVQPTDTSALLLYSVYSLD